LVFVSAKCGDAKKGKRKGYISIQSSEKKKKKEERKKVA